MRDLADNAQPARTFRRFAVPAAMAIGVTWLGPACDNPACVFGPNGCNTAAAGSTSGAAATVPVNHQWIESGVPTVVTKIPAAPATTLGPDSPMAIVFSESMSAASLSGALRLEDPATGGVGAPTVVTVTLVGDGRVAVIVPLQALTLDTTYNAVWSENAAPVDLQGQALAIPTDRIAGTFKVAATAFATVRLLGAFPADSALNQSGVGEFVTLFDRKLNPVTVTPLSFDIKVGGLDPTFDPQPTALSITSGGATASDTRVYRWRSVDGSGNASPLGPGLQVDCSLSPLGSKIAAVDGSQLPAVHTRYTIANVSPPLSATIVSQPSDAIGLDSVTGPKTLDIQVELASAQVGDHLSVFIFGNSVGANPKRLALFRDTTLTTASTTQHLGELELDLATDPDVGRLADGTLNFAFRMQRGSVTTPIRLLDADVLVDGVQAPLLDMTRPTLTGLGPIGTSATVFRSDLRDFALVGRASERIRAVEVSTTLGNNGVLTPVVGSTSSGLFVAAPIQLGTLTPAQQPLSFSAQIYDSALNSALVPIAGNFTQLGAAGPGAALPGPSITVDVFDSANFSAIANARVMIHEDLGGGTVFPVDVGFTDAGGRVTLAAGLTDSTIVTVDVNGFDLFTFEDVPTDRLSVPLTRSGLAPASVGGFANSTDSSFPSFDRTVVDSRRFGQSEPTITVQSCTSNPVTQSNDCVFGPALIRGNRLGVASLFALEVPPTELSYNVVSYLRAFQIAIPVAQVGAGTLSNVTLVANTMLNDAGVDIEERGIDGPALTLDLSSTTGILLNSLDGAPRILVEAKVLGLPGTAAVGQGVAFDLGGNSWSVRSAYPGVADGVQDNPGDALGKLVADGAIDPDLRLSCEVRDTLGARAGRRPAFSLLGNSLQPVSAPVILSPLPGASTGAPTFDLQFTNAIPDSAGTPGMYVATLTAANGGRRWTLWRPDLDDASGLTRTIHVPDLAALGGTALPDGSIAAVVEAFGYATFTASAFHWSDIEREYDSFSAGVPTAFTQP